MTKKILLIFGSGFLALLVCELYFTFVNHRYHYAARASYQPDLELIYSRKPNHREVSYSPRTGNSHLSIYNNLGLRQSRDFDDEGLKSALNIALFGDSLLENIRMPAQFSFSEPVDFVVDKHKPPVNILNFGVEGYGIDQSYTQYRIFREKIKPKLVFFFFIKRHIRILQETQLYQKNELGQFVHVGEKRISFPVSLLSQLNLTYFFLENFRKIKMLFRPEEPHLLRPHNLERDEMQKFKEEVWQRTKSGESTDRFQQIKQTGLKELMPQWKIFLEFLRQWKSEVERDGGKFFLVLIPRPNINDIASMFPKDIDILNLYAEIKRDFLNYRLEDVSYPKDLHWDERGNALAAFYVSRFILSYLTEAGVSDDIILSDLRNYYSAMSGTEFLPEHWNGSNKASAAESEKIRRKYLALEFKR